MAKLKIDPLTLLHKMQQASKGSSTGLPEQVEVAALWSGLGFRLADLQFVTPLNQVSEILVCPTLTLVPGTRPWLKGIANVRGNLYTIIDLPEYFGKDPVAASDKARLMIMNVAGLNTGLLVDDVLGLRHFDEEQESQDISGLDDPTMLYVRKAFLRDNVLWGVFDMQALAENATFKHVAA